MGVKVPQPEKVHTARLSSQWATPPPSAVPTHRLANLALISSISPPPPGALGGAPPPGVGFAPSSCKRGKLGRVSGLPQTSTLPTRSPSSFPQSPVPGAPNREAAPGGCQEAFLHPDSPCPPSSALLQPVLRPSRWVVRPLHPGPGKQGGAGLGVAPLLTAEGQAVGPVEGVAQEEGEGH